MSKAPSRLRRLSLLAAGAGWCMLSLALNAPSAFASYGRGLYGSVNDKAVTYTGLSLIAFFPIFVFVMSRLQYALEKRKDRRKAGHLHAAHSNGHIRGGW